MREILQAVKRLMTKWEEILPRYNYVTHYWDKDPFK
jgi:hypothetical protein